VLPMACLAVLVVEVQCSAGVVHRRVLAFLQHIGTLLSGRTTQVCPSIANTRCSRLILHSKLQHLLCTGSSASTTEVMQAG
jgi:hypothetical protein